MASVTLTTNFFRASHVHLKEPYAHQATDTPKYSIECLIPKNGQIQPDGVAQPLNASWDPIYNAIKQVCLEQWQWQIDDSQMPNIAQAQQMGIQFPPQFKDGDAKPQKDQNGNPQPGTVDPITAGMWRLNINSYEQPMVFDPQGNEIKPGSEYSGCYGRATIEVSAFENRDRIRIIKIDLIAFQMAYHGERLGGSIDRRAAAMSAMQGMAITDTNVEQGFGAGAGPAAVPQPQTPPAAPAAAPATPAAPAAPATPAAPPAPATPAAPATPPAPPAAPPAPAAPQDPVVLSDALKQQGVTYQGMVDQGWTDDAMIQAGHATPNFLNPAQ